MGPDGSGLDIANEIKGENGLSKSTPVFLLSNTTESRSPYWNLFNKTFSKRDAMIDDFATVVRGVVSVINDTKAIIAEKQELAKPVLVIGGNNKQVPSKTVIRG